MSDIKDYLRSKRITFVNGLAETENDSHADFCSELHNMEIVDGALKTRRGSYVINEYNTVNKWKNLYSFRLNETPVLLGINEKNEVRCWLKGFEEKDFYLCTNDFMGYSKITFSRGGKFFIYEDLDAVYIRNDYNDGYKILKTGEFRIQKLIKSRHNLRTADKIYDSRWWCEGRFDPLGLFATVVDISNKDMRDFNILKKKAITNTPIVGNISTAYMDRSGNIGNFSENFFLSENTDCVISTIKGIYYDGELAPVDSQFTLFGIGDGKYLQRVYDSTSTSQGYVLRDETTIQTRAYTVARFLFVIEEDASPDKYKVTFWCPDKSRSEFLTDIDDWSNFIPTSDGTISIADLNNSANPNNILKTDVMINGLTAVSALRIEESNGIKSIVSFTPASGSTPANFDCATTGDVFVFSCEIDKDSACFGNMPDKNIFTMTPSGSSSRGFYGWLGTTVFKVSAQTEFRSIPSYFFVGDDLEGRSVAVNIGYDTWYTELHSEPFSASNITIKPEISQVYETLPYSDNDSTIERIEDIGIVGRVVFKRVDWIDYVSKNNKQFAVLNGNNIIGKSSMFIHTGDYKTVYDFDDTNTGIINKTPANFFRGVCPFMAPNYLTLRSFPFAKGLVRQTINNPKFIVANDGVLYVFQNDKLYIGSTVDQILTEEIDISFSVVGMEALFNGCVLFGESEMQSISYNKKTGDKSVNNIVLDKNVSPHIIKSLSTSGHVFGITADGYVIDFNLVVSQGSAPYIQMRVLSMYLQKVRFDSTVDMVYCDGTLFVSVGDIIYGFKQNGWKKKYNFNRKIDKLASLDDKLVISFYSEEFNPFAYNLQTAAIEVG